MNKLNWLAHQSGGLYKYVEGDHEYLITINCFGTFDAQYTYTNESVEWLGRGDLEMMMEECSRHYNEIANALGRE